MKSLAQRLKETREEAGLSQSELARRAGVSQSTINNIESTRNQGSKHLFAIATALGVSAIWLAEGRGERNATATLADETEDEFDAARKLTRSTANAHSEYFPVYDYMPTDKGDIRWIARSTGVFVPRDALAAMGKRRVFPLRALLQRDASMAPMMFPGDIALVDSEMIAIRDNAVYAILFEGDVIFRQVLKQIGGAIVLQSLDARRYPDKVVPADMLDRVDVLGQVIYRAGPLPMEAS